ncbi:hypothetical protein SRB5_52890 [Streptomyces sp. RB5]|uniref:Uncharacterized protein n=1 Tax=Streptomyces smaragdinus TaxID=2585196 RepID=A0A7K0CNX6_9ACTN|nr:hypothetical protein [Streptomyces smaragdinus]MQY15111.1 hypothetical protein [Streptomyces smaragdinus]
MSAGELADAVRDAVGSAAATPAAANSRTNARRPASALTPIVLATAFTSTLVFMHTSESRAMDRQLPDHVVTSPAGLPATAAVRAASADGVTASVGVLRTSVLTLVSGAGDRWPQPSSAQGVSTVTGLPSVLDLDVRTGDLSALTPGTVALRSAHAAVGDRVKLRLPGRAVLRLPGGDPPAAQAKLASGEV